MKQYNNAKLALMKTLLLIVVIIMFSCSMLIGCSNNSKNAEKQIACIRITQRCGNKKWILSDKDTIIKFIGALGNREETDAKLDREPPDYFVSILYTDESNEDYLLWIDKDVNIPGVLLQGNKTWYINKESNSIFKEILR